MVGGRVQQGNERFSFIENSVAVFHRLCFTSLYQHGKLIGALIDKNGIIQFSEILKSDFNISITLMWCYIVIGTMRLELRSSLFSAIIIFYLAPMHIKKMLQSQLQSDSEFTSHFIIIF